MNSSDINIRIAATKITKNKSRTALLTSSDYKRNNERNKPPFKHLTNQSNYTVAAGPRIS